MDQLEWQSRHHEFRRRRARWFTLALLPSVVAPLITAGLILSPATYGSGFLFPFMLPVLALAVLGWIACSNHNIMVWSSKLSGRPISPVKWAALCFLLLLMNLIIGGALFFAGCVITMRITGYRF